MKCFGCNRELEVGDLYIEDTASGFMNRDADVLVDGLVADLFGSDGKVVFCEDCVESGGEYLFETVYGDEDDES